MNGIETFVTKENVLLYIPVKVTIKGSPEHVAFDLLRNSGKYRIGFYEDRNPSTVQILATTASEALEVRGLITSLWVNPQFSILESAFSGKPVSNERLLTYFSPDEALRLKTYTICQATKLRIDNIGTLTDMDRRILESYVVESSRQNGATTSFDMRNMVKKIIEEAESYKKERSK